ncbi:MAG TPA: hypothetical protein VGH93_15030 [Solirubrobacteraceae bacterium]
MVVVAFAAIASPAFAKHSHRRHRHAPKHVTALQIHLPAQQTQSFPSGWATLDVSGSVIRLSGNPLDDVNNPLSVDAPGIVLNLSSASIFTSPGLCAQRQQQCGASPSAGAAWIPVNASFLSSQDVVTLQLAVRDFVATADASSGVAVPVSWLYDVY